MDSDSEIAESTNTEQLIEIYTDGSCLGNPGPGGWGVMLTWRGETKELSGGAADTTNNRMELMAAIQAIEALKRRGPIKLHTDSKYVRNGITDWIKNWKKNGWKTAAKKPVKNADLWQRLDKAIVGRQIDWIWVKGHAGDPGNERADMLATEAAAQFAAR